MTRLLDTDTCILHLNGRSKIITTRLASCSPGDVGLCSVVKAELWHGAVKTNNPARRRADLSEFFSLFDSVPFDDAAAEAYGELRASLERGGRVIGPNDLMIAAIALSRGLTVVTRNVREFHRVRGLVWEYWDGGRAGWGV